MVQHRIEWVGTSNFTPGRGGRTPLAIVNHITGGLDPGTRTWMQNPAATASAHYLILQNGRILQLVKDEDTAWAVGFVNRPSWPLYDGTNPNRYTLSIEHENLSGGLLTEEQYQASLWLHQQLIERWHIPISRDHIIGHNQIDTVNRPQDPGPNFPWQRLFSDLHDAKGGGKVPEPWKEQLVEQAQQEGLITQYHNPDDPASKWFVLAVALNLLKKLTK
ncbi:MAG: N-acetylmuramoyl-L-alanine amidase [Bacillota bacterium]|nr:N-acetylmuramoyl-L-alanine amidase [Bacillota bacterium]